MFKPTHIKRAVLALAVCGGALAGSARADTVFDFSQAGSLSAQAGVSFANAVEADLFDADFKLIGHHWIVDASAPAPTLEAMSAYGYNGSAAAGVTGLQALWQPVLMQFAAPLVIDTLRVNQDDSGFGFPGMVELTFLDADGQPLGAALSYQQNAVSSVFAAGPAQGVSAVLLAGGKFYTGIALTTAVPEPRTYTMLMAGMLLLGVAGARRKG